MVLRVSEQGDLPVLKQLWKLSFGDEGEYIEHFFASYFTPERMLVLERDGQVRAMTAWFDMPLVSAAGKRIPAAYLYAVATHPDCRGQGLAGQLLDFAGRWLGERGFACLTTVPARPDLHEFFGKNGFLEGFILSRREYDRPPEVPRVPLVCVDGAEYGRLRERRLAGTPHVAYAPEGLAYQQGVCALSGGGLYRVGKDGCACVEVSQTQVFVKELLADDPEGAVSAIAARYPRRQLQVRAPWKGQEERWQFAMLRPLAPMPEWDGEGTAYLGLAFD